MELLSRICFVRAMRKSETNRPRMFVLLSHECLPSADSCLHAKWRRPTSIFLHVAFVSNVVHHPLLNTVLN